MTPSTSKSLLPHLAALGLFILIAVVYCKPALQGMVVQQGDILHWKGMSKEIQDYSEAHGGKAPLWTTRMFGGMPGYQIATNNNNYLSYYLDQAFGLFIPKPFRFFILACLGFYFLCMSLRINPWLAMVGSIGYAYASYNAIIVSVGHDTKMLSIAYLPAALGALWMIYQGRYALGTALTALFCANLVFHNHYQIVYYFLIMASFMTLGHLVQAFRKGETGHMLKSLGLAALGGLIGVLTNAIMLFTTYDYSKATIRGGQASIRPATDSVLTEKKVNGGLDTAYAFMYGSYGVSESLTLLVPDMYGGGSNPVGEDSKLVETMQEKGLPPQLAENIYSGFASYWGNQPGHAGPVYLGAVFCLLFVFGMFFLDTPHKWWMLAASVFAILMSWGKNFGAFNNLMFETLPLYNKFRAPAMILVIPQVLFPLLSVMAVQELASGKRTREEAEKAVRKTLYVMGGVFLLLAFLYFTFDYKAGYERDFQQQIDQVLPSMPGIGKDIVDAVVDDRRSMFGSDLIRSLAFAGLTVLLLLLFNRRKIGAPALMGSLLLLAAIDMIGVCSRYLNKDNYMVPEDFEGSFAPTEADMYIQKDPEKNFRVFNLAQNPFNDAITSYHHRSVGGYHAAKLSIYQDLIENQLSRQPVNIGVLNMLNTKYVIDRDSTGRFVPQQNPGALGSAWFVREVKVVPDAWSEMKSLDSFDPAKTAFVQAAYGKEVRNDYAWDSTANIQLVANENDIVRYTSQSNTPQFAVFSEIFYDRGWKAFVDGKESPIVRTNYVLRGLSLPAGKHDVEFRFEPASYRLGRNTTWVSQAVLLALLLAGIWLETRRNKSPSS